jgi:hypothetical protein
VLKIALFTPLIVALAGCATTVEFTQYSQPPGKPTANVELIALDKYRNTDTIDLFLLSRSSCAKKPTLAQVTWVGTEGFFGKDSFYRKQTTLPASERINLQISNRSSSSQITTHCNAAGSVIFETDKRYVLKVSNWSSKNSEWSGFGCEFNVFEVDDTGKEMRLVKLNDVELPRCETK